MNILFICGSLERGRDGVGDYTRRLSCMLKKLGHQTSIIALNDDQLQSSCEVYEDQQSDGESVRVLRLPTKFNWPVRTELAKIYIKNQHPEWLSLQYVPYSFHRKGLPIFLTRYLRAQIHSPKWHIMFHELWENGTSWKRVIVGAGQKLIAKSIVRKLNVTQIHTSTSHNLRLLHNAGLPTRLLPLFGNIPTPKGSKSTWKPIAGSDCQRLRGLYFGAAPNPDRIQPIIEGLSEVISKSDVELELNLAGSLGVYRELFTRSLEKIETDRITISQTGFIREEELGRLMSECHFGMSRSTAEHLGKSGSLISMIEHGLPVWCPLVIDGQGYGLEFTDSEKELIWTNLLQMQFSRKAPKSRLQRIAKQFSDELEQT